jgi:hypothetical protein
VVNIIAREITDDLTSLVKKIDTLVGENKDKKMAAFFVLLSNDPRADEKKLQELAKKQKIKNIPLMVYEGITGPPNFKLAKKADVTIMMWVGKQKKIKVNHALTSKDIKAATEEVVRSTKKILKTGAL